MGTLAVQSVDVIIVGSGPAGLSTALHLLQKDARWGGRVLLVGDAAGIAPLLGEGISPALAFGRVAADAIEAAFRSNDFSLKDYGRRVFLSEVGGYLSLRWLVAYWVYSIAPWPALMHAFWTLIWMLSKVWPDPPPLY
jgi:flavin-dependent dehydrogenase